MSDIEVIVVEVEAPIATVEVEIPGLRGSEGRHVVSGEVVDGQLILTQSDDSTIEVDGSVVGPSAYDVAVAEGFIGDEAAWLASLVGDQGDEGPSAYDVAVAEGFVGDEAAWLLSLKGDTGDPGDSAYEVAVAEGFSGDEVAWLASLVGDQGDEGPSAYDVAVAEGFVGDEAAWLASLVGDQGDEGLSAYEVAVANGFVGDETAWLASLEGATGADGVVQTIGAGSGISVDSTDPANPVISATGGGGDVAGDTHAASSKATPVDADEIPLVDSAASWALKKLTWANIKATAKTYFDTLYQATSARLTDIAALTATDSNIIVGNGTTWVAESGSTARTSLGVAIGTDVQAYSARLVDIAALAVTDSNIIVGNGSTWVAESGATARTSLGVAIGSNVQAWSTHLDAVAALSKTDGNFIVTNGTTFVAESGATARSSLGVAIGSDVQAYSAVLAALASGTSLTSGVFSISGTASAGSSMRLYEDTDNGTNYVGLKAPNSITSNIEWTMPSADGSAGQVLTTNGSGTLAFDDAGGGAYEYVGTYSASAATSLIITAGFNASYDEYVFVIKNMATSTSSFMTIQVYDDGGTTPIAGTNYSSGGASAAGSVGYWRVSGAQAASNPMAGEIRIIRASTVLSRLLSYVGIGSASAASQVGTVTTTAKTNAVRFSVDSGNITIDLDMYRVKST